MHDQMSILNLVLEEHRRRRPYPTHQNALDVRPGGPGRVTTWISSLARKRHR